MISTAYQCHYWEPSLLATRHGILCISPCPHHEFLSSWFTERINSVQPLQSSLRQLALDAILLSEERKGGWHREKEEGESVVRRRRGRGEGTQKEEEEGKGRMEEQV